MYKPRDCLCHAVPFPNLMLGNVVFLPEQKLLQYILLWSPALPGECHENNGSSGVCLKFLELVGDADGDQGWKMRRGGGEDSTLPQSPTQFSVAEICPGHTLLAHPCHSSQSSAIPAPHTAGALFLGSCSYRCCQTHPLCPLHRSLCPGHPPEMLRAFPTSCPLAPLRFPGP